MSNPGNVAALLLRQHTDGMTWCPESAAGSPGQGGPGSIAVPLPEPGNFNQALKHPRGLANQSLSMYTASHSTRARSLAARLNRNIPQLPDRMDSTSRGKHSKGLGRASSRLLRLRPSLPARWGPKISNLLAVDLPIKST